MEIPIRLRTSLPLLLAAAGLVATSVYAAAPAGAATNYGLNYPEDIAISGGDAFVVNSGASSITEFNINTYALVRILRGKAYHFGEPGMIVISGADAFVAADSAPSITEFNVATGALVRVLGAKSYGFLATALAVDGPDVFVTNFGGGLAGTPASVTEFNASSGALVRVLKGASYDFSGPRAITFAGGDGFVVNFGGNSVTEFNVATGTVVRVLSAKAYGFNWPDSVAISGTHGFVVNTDAGGAPNAPPGPVTEFNVATGAFVRMLTSKSYGFGVAGAVVSSGPDVFISGVKGIVDVNAASGAVVHTMHAKRLSTFKGGELPALGGHHLLVADPGINTVEEFNITTGNLVLSITSHPALPSA